MIKRLLRQLRKQPKASRDNVAFISAGILTGIVAFVWVYHAPERLGVQESGVLSSAKDEPGFWQLFSDFGSQMASVRDAMPEPQNDLTAGAETTDENLIDPQGRTSFNNSVGSYEENPTGTSTGSAGFLESERAPTNISSQPIRIITVSSTATASATTSESW